MKIFYRFIYLSAVATIICMLEHAPVFAEDCTQNRATLPAPHDIYEKTNPLKSTPENLLAGRKLYLGGAKPFGCYPCHGINGNGKGMTAMQMLLKPRDFTCQAMMQNIPDGQLFWIIRNGSEGTEMAGYKTLNDDEIWKLVSYIRQFSN
jgi:mono/diheme cytochrome c family protein